MYDDDPNTHPTMNQQDSMSHLQVESITLTESSLHKDSIELPHDQSNYMHSAAVKSKMMEKLRRADTLYTRIKDI